MGIERSFADGYNLIGVGGLDRLADQPSAVSLLLKTADLSKTVVQHLTHDLDAETTLLQHFLNDRASKAGSLHT